MFSGHRKWQMALHWDSITSYFMWTFNFFSVCYKEVISLDQVPLIIHILTRHCQHLHIHNHNICLDSCLCTKILHYFSKMIYTIVKRRECAIRHFRASLLCAVTDAKNMQYTIHKIIFRSEANTFELWRWFF